MVLSTDRVGLNGLAFERQIDTSLRFSPQVCESKKLTEGLPGAPLKHASLHQQWEHSKMCFISVHHPAFIPEHFSDNSMPWFMLGQTPF